MESKQKKSAFKEFIRKVSRAGQKVSDTIDKGRSRYMEMEERSLERQRKGFELENKKLEIEQQKYNILEKRKRLRKQLASIREPTPLSNLIMGSQSSDSPLFAFASGKDTKALDRGIFGNRKKRV